MLLYRIFIFIFLFFFIAPSKLYGVNLPLLIMVLIIVSTPLLLYLKQSIDKVFFTTLSITLFILAIFFILSIYHLSFDFVLFSLIVYCFFISISSYVFVSWCEYIFKDDLYTVAIETILYVSLSYALISIMTLFLPGFADFIYSYYDNVDLNSEFIDRKIRSSGIFYGGFSIVSAYFFIAYCFSLIYLSVNKNCNFLIKIMPLVFAIAIVISGRFGLMLLFITTLLSFFLPKNILLISKYKTSTYLSVFSIGLLYFIAVYGSAFQGIISWAFEVFIGYFSKGEVSSASTNIIFGEMQFLPNNIVVGEGDFDLAKKGITVSSDSGYVMMGYFGGIMMLIPFLTLYFYTCSVFLCSSSKVLSRIGVIIFLVCLIGNIKDVYFFGISGVTQLYFIILFLSNKKSLKIN